MTPRHLEDLGPGAVPAHARADGHAVHLLHAGLHLRDCMGCEQLPSGNWQHTLSPLVFCARTVQMLRPADHVIIDSTTRRLVPVTFTNVFRMPSI